MIVDTEFTSFAIKPRYILSFYYEIYNTICLHAIDYISEKDREYCNGQWKIKYKQ